MANLDVKIGDYVMCTFCDAISNECDSAMQIKTKYQPQHDPIWIDKNDAIEIINHLKNQFKL